MQNLNTTSPEKLVLHNVTHKDAGWYTCVVSNTIGVEYGSAEIKVVDSEGAICCNLDPISPLV